MTVTLSLRTRASVSIGWKWSTRQTAAPACSARPSTTFKPNTWKSGRTPSATSEARTRKPGCDCICSMLARSDPCVSMAGLGAPAVPAVNSRTARSLGFLGAKTSGAGAVGVRASSSSPSTTTRIPRLGESSEDSPRRGCDDSSEESPRRAAGCATARRARSALAADASASTGSTAASSRASSCDGEPTFNGTATAPAARIARYATTNAHSLPATIATRSPGFALAATSAAAAAVRIASSPYVTGSGPASARRSGSRDAVARSTSARFTLRQAT